MDKKDGTDEITVIAAVEGDASLEDKVNWQITPQTTVTGPATPDSASNSKQITFHGNAEIETAGGSLDPNLPLEYEVEATLTVGETQKTDSETVMQDHYCPVNDSRAGGN